MMGGPIVIDGKGLGDVIDEELKTWVGGVVGGGGRAPGLSVVLVGNDPASEVYVRNKVRRTKAVGMESKEYRLPDTTTQEELLGLLDDLNGDPGVDGILVQLPLPEGMDSEVVINAIDPAKDVDGFHLLNVGMLGTGTGVPLLPCTPNGCMVMLKRTLASLGRKLEGSRAVVVGRSNIVGKPMFNLLLREGATVTVAHSKTKDIESLCREADILVAAVGRPEMVRGDWVKEGAVVIDVGINRIEAEGGKTRLVGDVHYEEAYAKAAAVTPVPGGVGPMTIGMLLVNTVRSYAGREGVECRLSFL
jgi:methylenetetrahydrofolate dehydrogenase (NADP+)/methenyltetrahydrofolate cyclohydrolase